MRIFKRLTAAMLALVLCLGMAPVTANAQQEEDVDASLNNDVSFHGENGFGMLLSDAIEEAQDEETEASQDYGISELTFDGNTATVSYHTLVDAVLTVAVYTEDHKQLIMSATAEVNPENDVAEVTFDKALPEYFTATAYLMDGYDFSPLCKEYTTSMYTKNMQDLLSSTVEDYEEELVLNLDEDNTTNFAVLQEDTKKITPKSGVNQVTADDENHIYTIKNADEQFTSLKEGDVISYQYGEGEFLITKVGSITVDGTTVTIVGAEVELEEVFSHVKVEFDSSDGTFEVDTTNMSPYVRFNGIEEGPQTYAWQGGGSKEKTISYDLLDLPEDDDAKIKFSGTVDLTIKADVKFYAAWGEQYVRFELTATLDLSVSLEADIVDFKVPLGYWHCGVTGLYIDFSPELVLSLEGKVSVGGSVTFTMGVEYDDDFGLQRLDKKPQWDITKTEAEVTFFFGVDFGPEVVVIDDDVAEIGLEIVTGLEVQAKLEKSATLPSKETPPERHVCKLCVEIEPKLIFKINGKAKLLGWDRLSISLELASWEKEWESMYYSIDKKQFGIGECPNKEYLVTLETLDEENNPITATVKGQYGDIWGTTNEEGTYQLYVRGGTHYLTATTLDKTGKKTIRVPSETKAVFVLSKNTTGSIDRPGYTPGSGVGGALGKVETGELAQQEKLVRSGSAGPNATWELYDSGNLYLKGSGRAEYAREAGYDDQIKRIVVEPRITYIGDLFSGCQNLTTVVLTDWVEEIGAFAFYECANLKTVENASQIKKVGNYAFYRCEKLSETEIGPSLETLGEYSFSGCKALSIELPSTLYKVPNGCFTGCKSVGDLRFGEDVTIGDSAFYGIAELTNITFDQVTAMIGSNAFFGCSNLETVDFGSSSVDIGHSAFRDCDSLTEILLNSKTTGLGDHAFDGCDALTKVTIDGSMDIGANVFRMCENLQDLTIKGFVKSIGAEAFYGTDLRKVFISGYVSDIGDYAFRYCYYLDNFYFVGKAPTFGEGVFDKCGQFTFYYHSDYDGWTPELMSALGGQIIWKNMRDLESTTTAEELMAQTPETEAADLETQEDTEEESSLQSIYGGEYGTETDGGRTLNTASFTGLVPGEEYILLTLAKADAEDLLSPANLLYIDQATAGNDGTLKFSYILSGYTGTSYAFACGPNGKDLKDATITFPTMYRSETPKAVKPTVTYGGKVLEEGIDYEISGEAGYSGAGTYTCVIRGIYDYSGTVICEYTVLAEEHTHTGGTATCKQGAYCEICWQNYGEPDPDTHMGGTEIRDAVPAGCSTPGYSGDTWCLDCGKKIATGEATPAGHKYENGSCSACGAKDPNAPTEPETTEPKPTEPKPTEPKPTEPKPTEPKPTEPKPTEPAPTEPEAPKVEGVTRLAGADRIVTSFLVADQLKSQMGIEKFDSIIVASGKTFADALPGSYLAAVKNAPILLTLPKDKFVAQTAEYIKANLKAGGTVYILGGTSAVPASMETAVGEFNVQRVAGEDRFGTNLAILKVAGVKAGDEILVCTAREFADSLSAAATGKPILLVYKKLTDAQKAYLATLSGNTFCVVGGTSAVPTSFENELGGYGSVSRLAGKDRLDTSVLVAKKYFPNATTSVVAYGWDFPDGLCGGSLAYATKSPLILAHSKEKLFKFTADYTVGAGLKAGYVLGGDKLVDDSATRAIFGMGSEPINILK